MTAWDEYLAATHRLDEERRAAASALAEQATALRAAREELSTVRQRIGLQQTRFGDAGTRYGVRVPPLNPTEEEVAAALPPASDPAAVLAALRHARATLDGSDAELTAVDRRGSARLADRPPALRNLVVYGAFALIVLVLQIILFVVASEQSLPLLAPVCGIVLPLIAFVLGWLTVGLVYSPSPGQRVDRTPLVGALVCLVGPVLVTCAGVGALAVLR